MTILFDKQWKMDEKEKTAAIAEVPEEFRETYACLLDEWEALNMQEVLRLSEILEDSGADETFWAFQKATAYLDMDLPKQAECCIDELNSVYPDNPAILLIKAICRQQNGDVYQAERLLESIYPPEEYNPFYYSVYGSVLEEREKRTAAYEQYRVAYEHFRDGYPSNEIFMDGIFQRMIELDMALELDMVEEDVDAYIAFLKGIKNTEEWQCQVNENLMLFAQYMSAEKNREPLCRLVNNLLDSGFMTSAIRLRELRLLARSPEVCAMIGDPKISKFTLELVEQTVLIG